MNFSRKWTMVSQCSTVDSKLTAYNWPGFVVNIMFINTEMLDDTFQGND